jgi:hypothetical protein
MKIEKGASLAVVVKQSWANLHGVKMFLRPGEGSRTDIRGVDESHVLFVTALDAENPLGLWIEVHAEKHGEDTAVDAIRMLIPWSQVLTIVVAEQFSPAIRQEARRIGFTGEIGPE